MLATIARRWPTALLLVWLPLVKWGLPYSGLRFLLFFGGGSALAALALWREGHWPRVAPLFAGPLRGVIGALYGYGLLVAAAVPLLYLPLLQPVLPGVVAELAALFDPMPVYLLVARGGPYPDPAFATLVAAGSLAEEWIFRTALFWRWLPSAARAAPDASAGLRARLPGPGVLLRLLAVSAGFAALHWPQPPGALLVALLGSLVLGLVLWLRRSFALVATLHVLFNWRLLL
jgi:membrane protease YdiL (CAAX protease family)